MLRKKYGAAAADLDEFIPPQKAWAKGTTGDGNHEKGRKPVGEDGKSDTASGSRNIREENAITGKRKRMPLCLNPKSGKHQYVKHCPETSELERKRLLEEYRAQKKARMGKVGDRRVGSLSGSLIKGGNTSLFSASFCGGAVEAKVLGDSGSDRNIVTPSVLHEVQSACADLKVA